MTGHTDHVLSETHDLYGNRHAQRAIEIAAAGHHALLIVGSAAAPKTPIARRILQALPPLSGADLASLALIYGATGSYVVPSVRPFRAPHWTASEAGLIGAGGARCQPGEVSLAHAGVLYLENAPEFRRSHLDAVVRTVRAGTAFLARDAHCAQLPARPLVVASADPCPCGVARGRCVCSPERAATYLRRVVPLLPLLDLRVDVALEERGEAWDDAETIAARVRAAQRFREARGASDEPEPTSRLLLSVRPGRHFSALARAMQPDVLARRLRVARTIADLDGSASIQEQHVGEALRLTSGLEVLS